MDFRSFISFEEGSDVPTVPHMHSDVPKEYDAQRDSRETTVCDSRIHRSGKWIQDRHADLELRGAGNLLGAEQHGHMNAVGYDLYCKMLSEAVKEAKKESIQWKILKQRSI